MRAALDFSRGILLVLLVAASSCESGGGGGPMVQVGGLDGGIITQQDLSTVATKNDLSVTPPEKDMTQEEVGTCDNIVGDRQAQVCLRWSCDRMDLSEGSWSGSVSSCEPGDLTATARENALRMVNLFRFLADLPAVKTDSVRDEKAQACALMMDANNTLDHTPPTDWLCYTADGAEAAGHGNISSGRAVSSVKLYMDDPGNSTTIGHRRWILSNQLGPIGIGGTSGSSCMWVLSGSGTAGKTWMSWPPPGPVPYDAVSKVDAVGWTVQSNTINLDAASVTVTDSGVDKPVTLTQLLPNYGSTYAFRFNPDGWTMQAGHTYHVAVSGVSPAITYDVEVVSCP